MTLINEFIWEMGARSAHGWVRHGRCAIFQLVEAALPQPVCAGMLGLINGLRDPPAAAA